MMPENETESLQPSKNDRLAKAFARYGWGGFWSLVLMGAVPVIIMVYTFIFSDRPSGTHRSGLPFVQFFSTMGLALLVFITFWFYRYTRIANRLQEPGAQMNEASLRRKVGTGLAATSLALVFSFLVMLFEVGTLLFYFLSAPQAGLPTFQTTLDGFASWVSAVDMINLLSMVMTLGGEIFAIIFGLLLLYRIPNTMPECEGPLETRP
jgi:magnesium-transporting ATPase (P-type)